MILIITSKTDGHIESVTRHLDAAGRRWVRVNTEDAATNMEMVIKPSVGDGDIMMRDSLRSWRIADVKAVWYRKPEVVDVSHLGLDGGARDYVEAEFREILDGLYGLLHTARWINNPFDTRLAHRKLLQLKVATEVGFATPATIITNIESTATAFAMEQGGSIAIKSLGALCVFEDAGAEALQYGIFTRRVSTTELATVGHTIANLATSFQNFVPKAHELRVTCVGPRAFACKIVPREDDVTADDYRFDTRRLHHEAVDCPDQLQRQMQEYMRRFNLHFAAFDFIVTPDGETVFLEANPNGQWLWVENLTGLQIGKAVAAYLMENV